MCITEYNQEAVMKMLEKEAFEKGFKKGFKIGLEKGEYRFSFLMVDQSFLSLERAAEFLNVSSETYRQKLEKYHQDPESFMSGS